MNFAKLILYEADRIEEEYRWIFARRRLAMASMCICIMAIEALNHEN